MKLLVFGASGSGTTTLGKEVAKRAGFIHLDADDYYWVKTEKPFTKKVPFTERNESIKKDFFGSEDVIISGSMISWGKEWETLFDLAVFIHLDNDIRMKRLEEREFERYGDQLKNNQERKVLFEKFMEWANQYENPDFEGRSLRVHNDWIKRLDCKVLRLEGDLKLSHKIDQTLAQIEAIKNESSIRPKPDAI